MNFKKNMTEQGHSYKNPKFRNPKDMFANYHKTVVYILILNQKSK